MRPNLQETADLVTFTEEILNEKLHFLCSEYSASPILLYSVTGYWIFDILCDLK